MQNFINMSLKFGRMKLQKKQSSLEFSKRWKGFIWSRKLPPEGRQQPSVPKPGGSTSIEKGQDSQSSKTPSTSFANRNIGKSLRSVKNTTNPTPTHIHHSHLHLHHKCQFHTNLHLSHQSTKLINSLRHNMITQILKAH
jgi:hypothetical protein